MIKANTKKFRENLKKYMEQIIEKDVQTTYKTFINAYYKTENEKSYFHQNEFEALKSWLCGVPSSINVELCTWSQAQILGGWHEETPEQIDTFFNKNSAQCEKMYLYHVARYILDNGKKV